MSRHSKRIFGCHIKTFRGKRPAGRCPWARETSILPNWPAAVKSTGWAGWLIVEEGGGPKGGNTAALGPDRQYIRRLFGI